MFYGDYRPAQFLIELNRETCRPGDFFLYISLQDISECVNNPSCLKDSILTAGVPDDVHESSENVLISINTVYHELTHLYQDFALGSEMMRDFMEDTIGYYVYQSMKSSAVHKKKITFPINLEKDMPEEANILINRYKTMFLTDTLVELGYKNNDKEHLKIRTEDLLEAYAAARSYLYLILKEPKSHDFTTLNRIFFMKNMDEVYKKVWKIYKHSLSFEDKDYEGGATTEKLLTDINGFLLVCDIALHIPPFLHNEFKTQNPYEVPDYCIPGERFMCALKTLARFGGFPDAIEGTDFYFTLYDFVAKDNGWPLYKQVDDMWMVFLQRRLKFGVMISDYYRLMVAHYKLTLGSKVIFDRPITMFSEISIPIIVRYFSETESFFEFTQFHLNGIMPIMDNSPFSPMRNPYFIMSTYYHDWTWNKIQDAYCKKDKELYSLPTAFLREIYCRIISKKFFSSAINGNHFGCPMIEFNCRTKNKSCECLKKLTQLPKECCIRIWMNDLGINPEYFMWK